MRLGVMQMISVLHVEDNEIDHELTKLNLLNQTDELEITWIDSGQKALELLETQQYDCILSDFQMPGIDGMEFLKSLRDKGNTTPFIFFTSQGNEQIAAEALRYGADDYYTKDVSFAHYYRLLNSIRNQKIAKKHREEIKLAQDTLRKNQELNTRIIESMNDGLLVLDKNFHYVYWNHAMEELSGIPREKIVNREILPWEKFPHLVEQGVDKLMRIAMSGTSCSRDNIPYKLENGKEGYTSEKFLPLRDVDGSVSGIVLIVRDVTQDNLAKEKLETELNVNRVTARLAKALIDPANDAEELANLVLEEAKSFTKSEHGFVSVIDPHTGDNVCYTLADMMKQLDTYPEIDPSLRFPMGENGEYDGLWGHALNTLKGFYTNSPAQHEAARGFPEHHVTINNYLSVPAIIGDKLVGQISLANSESGYTDKDLAAIERFADLYAISIIRKLSEEAVQENEEKYRSLFEKMTLGIVIRRADGEIVSANPASEKILEASEALLQREGSSGRKWEIFHEDGIPVTKESLPSMIALKTGKEVRNVTLNITCPEADERKWVNVTAVPQFKENEDRPFQAFITLEDITQRKLAESNLRFTQFAIDRSSEAAFWLDSDAHFTYVNEAACRSLGYSEEELLGMTVHDIDPDFPPEKWARHWTEIKQRGSFTVGSTHKTKDGLIFPVEVTVNYLEFEGKEYNCTFARDITERAAAEKALVELEEKYQALLTSC